MDLMAVDSGVREESDELVWAVSEMYEAKAGRPGRSRDRGSHDVKPGVCLEEGAGGW